MSIHLQRDMDLLRQELMSLFGIVEQMIDQAVRALCEHRGDLAKEIIEQDDYVDRREVRIEEECLKILALHQPVASNLRIVATVLKINADLERIADLACNIAERAQALNEFPHFPIPDDLPRMARESTEMLRRAVDSFVNLDAKIATQVIQLDDQIDELNRRVIYELRNQMKEDPASVEPALHCFSGTRHIERIGDLAENIAEDVIYIVEGNIVRHKHDEFLPNGVSKS